MFIVRYGEIGLKGKNRKYFESTLASNIKRKMDSASIEGEIKIYRGRIMIYLKKDYNKEMMDILSKTPGIVSYSIAEEMNYNEIKKYLLYALKDKHPESFRVRAQRIDKRFPKKSPEINEDIGSFVYEQFGWKVNLKNPELEIGIEIINSNAYVFFEKIKGIGGLPVGTAGKLLLLLSPGMDSPVAGYMMMRRGANIIALHFSQGPKGEEKVRKYIEKLSEFAPEKIELLTIPHKDIFLDVKEKLKKAKREEWTCIFCKYIMFKKASEIAKEVDALGIVTGDSLGQVASQTLQNMYIESSSSSVPIYRPVIGMDKVEIENISKRIETFEPYLEIKEEKCPFKPEHVIATAKWNKFEEVKKMINL